MYSLDINFLRDREIRPVDTSTPRSAAGPGDRRPLYYGLAVALIALGLVGGYWLLLQRQIRTLQAEEAQLDAEIAGLAADLQELETIRAQTDQVEAENRAFANVFDQIRPWSALLQDLRNRTPTRIQLVEIIQTVGTTPPDNPEAEPPVAGGIEVMGVACDFDAINDFLLVLKGSRLLDSESVSIVEAQRPDSLDDSAEGTDLPLIPDPSVFGSCPGTGEGIPDIHVEFTLQANLTATPASELLDVLDSQGAVGLSTRIRALRDSGVTETP